MAFEPSEYSTYDANNYGAIDVGSLIGMGIQAGTTIATTAITKKRPGSSSSTKKADQLQYIEAAKPSYNPMWVAAGGLVVAVVLGVVLLRRPAPRAAAAA